MNDFTNKFDYWTKELVRINTLLKPILDVPYTQDSSLNAIKNKIDKLGVNNIANAIVNEIMVVFPKVNSSQRQRISDLIGKNDRILWTLDFNEQTNSIKTLEKQLLWFIIRDQGTDTRDAILELNELVNNCEKLGFDVANMMKKYSHLASTKNKYGWGSTQSLILGSIK